MVVVRILAVIVVAAIGVLVPVSAANANTPPNPYTPAGSSWVDVPVGDRVYYENFGSNFDDYPIYYIGAGVTCTDNGITATGPFLTSLDLNDSNCVDAVAAPFDPIDLATRAGSTPFGFPINFFGTTYTSAYPNTNGGIYFDNPDSAYNQTLASLASNSESSAMFPLAADLYYVQEESNFWVAQTTVDGAAAVVFSWEKFHNCCTPGVSTEDISFQLVLIDAGSSDFNAWFNYDRLVDFVQGYTASTALVNLSSGVTVGSNVLTAEDLTGFPVVCSPAYAQQLGTATDTTFMTELFGPLFVTVTDATTISVWSDPACTVPINVNAVQDEPADLVAYLQLVDISPTLHRSIGAGWSTYDPTTGAIDATELLFNIDAAELVDGATNPLTARSLNTTVPGRFVIGQRGGGTVTDPGSLGSGDGAGGLPPTGSPDVAPFVALAGALLLMGTALVRARRPVVSRNG